MRASPFTSSPCSRRRALALAAGATALAQDPELSSLVGKIGLIPALMAPPEAPTVSLPAILPTTPPPAVAFLAKDMAVASGQRLPFVRDAEGRVGWVSSSLRLVPRVDAGA